MILIIDDDKAIQTSLQLLLADNGYRTAVAGRQGEALRVLKSKKVSLILMDMNFSSDTSGEDGLELLADVKEHWPSIPVILITGWGTIELAVEGMRLGASDFITKPWNNQRILNAVKNALALNTKKKTARQSREKLDSQYDFSGVIGKHPKMVSVLETVARVAPTTATVFLTGESGTGKEVIAEAIHNNSSRKDGPFVTVNLGAIQTTLFESEMFGHKKGAFTDAKADKPGKFELADGGTLFLDEIGETDLNSQVKLLRVLQEQKLERVGDNQTRNIDVRIICATNRNLPEMVAYDTFREDLFYRINLIHIDLCPLRERASDIELLAQHFISTFKEQYNKPGLTISSEALQYLKETPFPGNIRELKNLIERVVVVSGSKELGKEDFISNSTSIINISNEDLPEVGTMTLEEIEEKMVRKALEKYDYNISKAAKGLGLSRQMLYRRMEKYGINI